MIDLFNLVMLSAMGAYALIVIFIFARFAWQWATEPFRIAYQLEQEQEHIYHTCDMCEYAKRASDFHIMQDSHGTKILCTTCYGFEYQYLLDN